MKKKLSEQRVYNILQSVQIMQVLSEAIKIEFQSELIDTDLKNPAINQHAKRIKESASAIQIHLTGLVKNKDKEYFSYEYAVEMHRVIKHFVGMDINQVREFMDGVDEIMTANEHSH